MVNSVDTHHLSTLSDAETRYCGSLLEQVFLEESREIDGIDPAHFPALISVLKTFDAPQLKRQFLESFSRDQLLKLIWSMDETTQMSLFFFLTDISLLSSLFTGISSEKQGLLLKDLYGHDRDLYQHLRSLHLEQNAVQQESEAQVSPTAAVSEASLKADVAHVLALCEDATLSMASLDDAAAALKNRYSLEEVDGVVMHVVSDFLDKDIAIRDSETFSVYLRFFRFTSVFFDDVSALLPALPPLFDRVIVALSRLPDTKWVLKVLGQFPAAVICQIFVQLLRAPRIAAFEKRQIYSKLLNKFQAVLKTPSGQPFREAYEAALKLGQDNDRRNY